MAVANIPDQAQYGGYDFTFTKSVPDRYNCNICTKVLRDPHLTRCCGQHFCESCLEHWFRQQKTTCPHCRQENFNHFLNKALKREINELRIRCTKQGLGCQWVGELSSLQTHLDSGKRCGYVEVQCSNKCGAKMKRKELKAHLERQCPLRKIQCRYCRFEDTYQTITSKHYDECPHYPLPCPNKCGKTGIRRADMDNHRRKCELEPVECPFHEAGCKVNVVRKEFDSHMSRNRRNHLLVLLGAFQETKRDLNKSQTKLDECQRELVESRREQDGNRRELNECRKELDECLRKLDESRREQDANKRELNEYRKELDECQRKLIKNQRELDESRRERDESRAKLQNTSLKLIQTRKQLEESKPKSSKQITLKNGDEVTFRMNDYSLYKHTGKVWHSPPFYYGAGYKLCLAVYANGKGAGAGTHVSVELLQMKGEHDHKLRWNERQRHRHCCERYYCIYIQMKAQVPEKVVRNICANCFTRQSPPEDLRVFKTCSGDAVSDDKFIVHQRAEQVMVLNDSIALRVSLLEQRIVVK